MVASGRLLLEREAELDRLRALLETAAGARGALVLVAGPPGIGKTELARVFQSAAEEVGFRVLTARGAELEREYAFGVTRQWFEPLLRRGEVTAEGAAELAAAALVGDPAANPDPSYSLLHGLYWLTAGLAAPGPLALILDDAHWGDDASLRFVSFLARRLEGLPALVLLTAREPLTGMPAELACDATSQVLEPQPLGVEAVAELLRARAAGPVDDAFAQACRKATGGNPFLLTELVQGLLTEGVEFVAREKGRVPTLGARSVATAVQLRVARLSEPALRLARAAAVAGDDAPFPLVAELAGLHESAAEEAADELTGAYVLDDRRPLRFVHPIVGAATRETLLAGEREALHARAAIWLAESGAPPEPIAAHLLAVGPRGDEQTTATLREAARRAKARGAPEEAAALLSRALAEPPPQRMRPRLLLELGETEHALNLATANEHLREAHRLARDPRERARAALLLTSAVVVNAGDHTGLLELLEQSIRELEENERELALRLEAAWMDVAWELGGLEAVLERGERFEALAGGTPGECLVLAYLAHARMDAGRPAGGVARLAERAANPEFAGELALSSTWLIHTGTVLRAAERFEPQLRLLDRAIAEAQRTGAVRGYALASMYRAGILERAGDILGEEADARAALVDGVPEVVLLPALAILIDSLVEQARLDEASSLLAEHGLAGPLPDHRHATVLLFPRASLRANRGDTSGGLADLVEARRRLNRSGERLNVVGLDGRVQTALLRAATGAREEAECEAAVALEAATRWGTAGAIGTALRALGLVRREAELLEQAVESLAESPLRLEYARALVDLGALLRRGGRRADSREPLRTGFALAGECGGIAVRERARQELAATGIRIRREPVTGVAALTPSERRIADHAAAGATNAEIAQALFVTVKTVEMHLSNAYRKLGISGRRELARALAGCE